jgi:hypothetical protein
MELSRFSQAFKPHVDSTHSLEGDGFRNYVIITLIQIHTIATEILLEGVFFTEECSYDAYLPEFKGMLELIYMIVDCYHNRTQKPSLGDIIFSLDMGIIPALFLLGIRCRDGIFRRQAITILESWHAEVCWHPTLVAKLCTFIMEVSGLEGENGHRCRSKVSK